jgi:hypothetical protein
MADRPGGTKWGPLEVLERLGGGPSSEVFRARATAGGPVVALRLLPAGTRTDSARAAAFVERGRQLARVEHPHLVRVSSAGVHGGRAGRTMELVDGPTLAQLVDEQGPFAPQELVATGTALCRALGALHAAGVVHGDVRARNVVRARGQRVVLLDPGAEPLPLRGAAASIPLGAGSPAYFAAPELLRGEAPAPASDLYALGALLHLLATGALPVMGEDLLALRAAHEKRGRRPRRKLRRDLPPALAAAIDRALAHDPRARFADAAEMERALQAQALATLPAPPAQAPGGVGTGRPWTWVAVVVVAVAGAAGIWPLLRGAPESALADGDAASAPVNVAPALEVRLFRAGRLQDEPLGTSAQVNPGDELYLMLAPAEDQYLYVLHRSADGRLAALLPIAPGTAAERVPAGERLRVPPMAEGRIVNWKAGPGGVELFLALGAREPIALLDAALVGRTAANPLLLEGLVGRYFETRDPPPGGVTRRSFAVAVRER